MFEHFVFIFKKTFFFHHLKIYNNWHQFVLVHV